MNHTLKLYNGVELPLVGYGTLSIKDPDTCVNGVLEAIRTGYRLIDTAQFYGNEELVGAGVRAAINEGIVTREEIFVTTKVWHSNYETEDCRRSLEESFRKLDLGYIDMVLLHWPFGNVYAAWRVLEEYYEVGKIRAIGVSNMEADRLIDLIRFNKVRPAVNQIETHLYCQRHEERKWLDKLGIVHQAYSPLGAGRSDTMLQEPAVRAIAEAHGKTIGQVLLRYSVQRGISVIPKSSRPERIRENFDLFSFELTPAEMDTLRALDTGKPFIGKAEDPNLAENFLSR